MRNWSRIGLVRGMLVLVSLAVVGALGWRIWQPRGPVYHGKTARQWLENLYEIDRTAGRASNNPQRVECINAIKIFGTNVIPSALQLAATRESSFERFVARRRWVGQTFGVLGLSRTYNRWARASHEKPWMGLKAFEVLGERGSPAVPALVNLLRTGENPQSRVVAALMLSYVRTNAQEALPDLVRGFKDSDPDVANNMAIPLIVISSGNVCLTNHGEQFDAWCAYVKRSTDLIAPAAEEVLRATNVNTEPMTFTFRAITNYMDRAGERRIKELLDRVN